MAYEDPTTYIEVDPNSHIEETITRVTATTLARNESAYLYKDFGSDYFGNFTHFFQGRLSSVSDPNSVLILWGLSNTVANTQGWGTGLFVFFLYDSGQYKLYIQEVGQSPQGAYVISLNTTYYFTLKRMNTSWILNVYSDITRATWLTTISTTVATTTYKYLYLMASYNDSTSPNASGYGEYYDINALNTTIADLFSLADTTCICWLNTIADLITLTGESSWKLRIVNAEVVGLTDVSLNNCIWTKSIAESLSLLDSWPKIGWRKAIADAIALADLITIKLNVTIEDYVLLLDNLLSKWTGHLNTQEYLIMYDDATTIKKFLSALTETVTLIDSPTQAVGLLIIEYLTALEKLITNIQTHPILAEALQLTDNPLRAFGKTLSETLILGDSALKTFIATCIAHDAVAFSGIPSIKRTGNLLILEHLTTTDTVTNKARFKNLIQDGIMFDIRLVLGIKAGGVGDVTYETYQCWVLNTDEIYPSIYTNFDFNSYAQVGGQIFGAKDGVIYLIGGADDAGNVIKTGVRVNLYNMGTHYRKRIREAFFGVAGSAPAIKIATEDGEVYYYIVGKRLVEQTTGQRGPAKGQMGVTYTFDLAQVTELDFIEIMPIILMR